MKRPYGYTHLTITDGEDGPPVYSLKLADPEGVEHDLSESVARRPISVEFDQEGFEHIVTLSLIVNRLDWNTTGGPQPAEEATS